MVRSHCFPRAWRCYSSDIPSGRHTKDGQHQKTGSNPVAEPHPRPRSHIVAIRSRKFAQRGTAQCALHARGKQRSERAKCQDPRDAEDSTVHRR